jgi:predicted transcriptional regulator
MSDDTNRTQLTAIIVAAYVGNNDVPINDLQDLIRSVHKALSAVGAPVAEPAPAVRATAAQITRSVTPDALVSFEDGKRYKQLRRHLTALGLSPDGYRAKWGLPKDYPMVAASYSAQRSALAKSFGLGKKAQSPAAEEPPAVEEPKARIKGKLGLFGRRSQG